MKTKITKKTKKAICIYIIILLLLFLIVWILPKITDIFETTQVLEPGNLLLSYETTGYFVKDESIGIAEESGDISYPVEVGTVVKKGYDVVKVEPHGSGDGEQAPRFTDYTERLKGYSGLSTGYEAPISGVFSLTIDGYEDFFTFDRMEKLKRDDVEGLTFRPVDLKRNSVIKGEPIFKISSDDNWYIVCWVDEENVKNYSKGKDVTLQLPDGDVDADVYSIKKEDKDYRVIFHLDVYYKAFADSRAEDMTIVVSDTFGLIVDNKCIIEKDGKQGVYVKNKNGKYIFKRIQVIATDGKESVIRDVAFVDEDGNQVYTVEVYDEVLKHPESALEDDLEKSSEKEK